MNCLALAAPLSDGQVTLRPLARDDVSTYVRAFADDPELGRLQGFEADPDEPAARSFVERSERGIANGTMVELSVLDTRTGTFAGSVMVVDVSWRDRRCELGYWLAPASRGGGRMHAALTLVLGWLFGELGFFRVEIATTTENLRSQRVARALGFSEEARQRGRDIERGARVDVVRFGLLTEEWTPTSAPRG